MKVAWSEESLGWRLAARTENNLVATKVSTSVDEKVMQMVFEKVVVKVERMVAQMASILDILMVHPKELQKDFG